MFELERDAEVLEDFGLTAYEAKVYLSVVKGGVSTASEISELAGIRREEVYRTIPKLEERGLIERVLGRPFRVRALPLGDALNLLVERREAEASKRIQALVDSKESLLEDAEVYRSTESHGKEASRFALISEQDALEKRLEASIASAQHSIEIVDSFRGAFRFILRNVSALRNARKRGVQVRVLTESPAGSAPIPRGLTKHLKNDLVQMKVSFELPNSYMVFDGREGYLVTAGGKPRTHPVTLWTTDENLISMILRDYGEQAANSSEWSDVSQPFSEVVLDIMGQLRQRDHLVMVYESDKIKHGIVFAYLEEGLQNNESAVYVCSEERPESIRQSMMDFGLDLKAYEKKRALAILDYTDVYITEGEFDSTKAEKTWKDLSEMALSRGFKGIRIAGEAHFFFERGLIAQLFEYEFSLQDTLGFPATALCIYNAEDLSRSADGRSSYDEIIRSHKRVLYSATRKKSGRTEVRAIQ